MKKTTMIAAAAAATITGSALASNLPDAIIIDPEANGLALRARDMVNSTHYSSNPVFENAFSGPVGNFSNGDLTSIHSDLNANHVNSDSGFTTDNWVTVIAAHVDTNDDDVADALSLMFLIDEVGTSAPNVDDSIGFQSAAQSVHGSNPLGWLNDVGSDDITVTQGDPNDLAAGSGFDWDADTNGDAFAWSNLIANDEGSATFSEQNWGGFQGIQFVSWNEGLGKWETVGVELAGFGVETFSFEVIPLPPAAFAGLAGLGLAAVARRRFRK